MPASILFAANTALLTRTTLLPPIAGFTYMGWFRPTALAVNQTMFAYGANSVVQYSVQTDGTTATSSSIWNGSVNTAAKAGAFVAGRWAHWCLTVAGTGAGQVLLYRNGVLWDTGAGNASVTATKMWLGGSFTAAEFWNGNMAAVKLYNRVLTAGEIAAELPYALPVSWQGLNACYPIGQGIEAEDNPAGIPTDSFSRWPDVSGNKAEWTSAGAPRMENGPPVQWSPERTRFRPRYSVPAVVVGGATAFRRFLHDGGKSGSRAVA